MVLNKGLSSSNMDPFMDIFSHLFGRGIRVKIYSAPRRRVRTRVDVVDAGEELILVVDHRKAREVVLSIRSEGMIVEERGARKFITFPEPVDPGTARVEGSMGITELTLRKSPRPVEGERTVVLSHGSTSRGKVS